MNQHFSSSRRRFLKLSATLAGGGLLTACTTAINTSAPTATPGSMMGHDMGNMATPAADEFLSPRAASLNFKPDLELTLKATQAVRQLLPGDATTVWAYEGNVSTGDSVSLQTLSDTYLGPILRVRRGQKVRVNFVNDLPEQASIIHWHGLQVSEDNDAHPRYAIKPGQTYVYEFEIINRAGTYWFHPHTHGLTAEQVYRGLAGLFIVSDDEETQAGFPTGAQDVPLIVQDRTFDARNQLVYTGMSDMLGSMMGFLGQKIVVNGRPDFVLEVATRIYRLRLLNGSNSRIYKLAWGDGTPLTVIATDGGLLEQAVERPYVMLAPGERIELWADFSRRKVGEAVVLMTQRFEGAENPGSMASASDSMSGMDHSGMTMDSGSDTPPLGTETPILTVRVVQQEVETLTLPEKLSVPGFLKLEEALNASSPRPLALTLNGMSWVINGRGFNMDEAAETVKLNTTEIWEIRNEKNPGAMMDANGMAHPLHIHGVQFQVIHRQVMPDLKAGWDTVRAGYIDEGWKDTVLVMPGESVRLLMRFRDFTGKFVYHCHNLEHGDLGMMRNFEVVA